MIEKFGHCFNKHSEYFEIELIAQQEAAAWQSFDKMSEIEKQEAIDSYVNIAEKAYYMGLHTYPGNIETLPSPNLKKLAKQIKQELERRGELD